VTTRFRILDELGSGAMGVVYRAADTADSHRLVALKIVKVAGTVTPAQRLIFKEEYRAMTRLKHPNTIEVIDYGMLDEQTQFIAMELVGGQDLSTLLEAGRMPIAKVYPLVIQLLQALEFIHARLYVHRDIKSQNIRILADGTLKLMDFGLMSQMGLPANGRVTGTPGYLAPEVVKGGVINASTDLYAVGCLMYELITGRLPFVGKLLDVVRAHVANAPEPLERHVPDVPQRLAQIVARLLEKDQAARYQDAASVIDDLADLAGFAVTASRLDQKKSYLTASVLVAREDELATLIAALAAIGQGEGRAIVVGAPAGTGKSRLVQELLLQAKLEERPVLFGHCAERGSGPYAPLAEALRMLVPLSTADELTLVAPVMARLLPELGSALPVLEADAEKKRLHEALTTWIGSVARRRPLVLCLDDLHWADTGTLDALTYLLRQRPAAPVFVLGTYRSDEVPEGSALRFAMTEGLATPLALAPFGREQVLELISALLHRVSITPEYLAALYNATAGNAFFITEILRTLIEEHTLSLRGGTWHFPQEAGQLLEPTSVEETVKRRLKSLSVGGRHLAQVAAVIGRLQPLEMLQALADMTDDALFDALDELVERQFILNEQGQTSFPHDRVRDVLYGAMAPDACAKLHQRAGDFLEARGASQAELAHHFGHGTDREKAFRYQRAAGNACAAAGAPDMALAYWEDADRVLATLDIKQREILQVELWWDIGQLAFYVRPATAIAAFERLIPVLEARCSVDTFVKLLRRVAPFVQRLPAGLRGRMMARAQVYRPYKHVSARGFGRLAPVDLPAALGRVIECYGYMAVAHAYAGDAERGLAIAQKAIQMAPYEGTGLPFEGVQLMVIAPILLLMGHIDEALDVARRAAPLITDHTGVTGRLTRISHAAAVGIQLSRALQGQRPDPAIEVASLQASEAAGTLSMINEAWLNGAVCHAWTGRHEEARAYVIGKE
jgi:tetratricopeptide (TPR) repeat protein